MKVDTAIDTCMEANTEKSMLATGEYVHTMEYMRNDNFEHFKGWIIFR